MKTKSSLFAGVAILACMFFWACGEKASVTPSKAEESNPMKEMNDIAPHYVKLVLALGQHDKDYVDAYYGPNEWKEEAEAAKRPLEDIKNDANALSQKLTDLDTSTLEPIGKLRHNFLLKQLSAMKSRIAFLAGEKLSFDEEARQLYDAEPPTYDEAHFQKFIAQLETLLPGEGDLGERLGKFKESFVIPPDKVDAVFKAAIEEGRKRTAANIQLPENENFTVEYVQNKSWSGYNWYKGNATSLIQVNIDFPIYIDRAVDLACHEGYPGHHVYNALLEKHLVVERGWQEFSIYPLFSPQSLIAEGSANYGIQVVFSKKDRIAFERDVLFPLAGIEPQRTEEYYKVMEVVAQLNYAGNEAARGYINGTMTSEQAQEWLVKYALSSPDRAEQRLRFIDQFRSYVINYNLGQDLVAAYIEQKGGTEDNPAKRWELFKDLLSSPRLPSDLQ